MSKLREKTTKSVSNHTWAHCMHIQTKTLPNTISAGRRKPMGIHHFAFCYLGGSQEREYEDRKRKKKRDYVISTKREKT